jgi:hypothetical protein
VHAAPPVRVSLARSPGWIVFNALCGGIAGANLAAWWVLRNEAAGAAAIGVVCGAAAAAIAGWFAWRAQAPGDLNWDGTHWQWQGIDGQAQVAIDLGGWMLLRFEALAGEPAGELSRGRRRWIAASRTASRGPWHALRAALHAPQPAQAPPA